MFMDKNAYESEQQQSCCEKLFTAIRNPSPFIRTTRFISPTTVRDRRVRAPTPNLNDRCPRISKQTVTPPAADSRKQAANKPAVIDHKGNRVRVSSPSNNLAKPKTTDLTIHGHENAIPVIPHQANGVRSYISESINGMSTEYIDRAGQKIRSPTNVGARDSFNDHINDFISRTKHKFHNSSSFNEGSEGKQKRHK